MATTTRATTPGATTTNTTSPFPPLLDTTTSDGSSQLTAPTAATDTTTLPTISEHSILQPQSHLPVPFSTSNAALDISPKTTKFPSSTGFSPRRSPAPLTGAAAMADAKRKRQQQSQSQDRSLRETTPNPGVAAMQSLMGTSGVSRASDAPAPDKLSEPLRRAAEKIHIPQDRGSSTSAHTSPSSMSGFGVETNGHGGALTATSAGSSNDAMSGFVAEPDMMGVSNHTPHSANMTTNDSTASNDDGSNKAFSYPGPASLLQQQQQQQQQTQNHNDSTPARGMSLPGVGLQDSTRASPASKRHKCPYCATDFTRHHNLKSHLLTHSQEKPYVCQTCSARFRRLHDLKRHSKLHTGEKPHTCDKCGRRFARGDALARHNKGPGGCAGTRRSSFGGDDDMGDGTGDGMDGIEYTNDDDDDTTDVQSRRVSEPSRKRAHDDVHGNRTIYRQHSSTYPPVQQRPGEMGPPAVMHPNSGNASTSPRDIPGGATNYFPNYNQSSGITESPKPLSPGQPPDQHRLSIDNASSFGRNRSPSLTTQFQQTHFGRGSVGGGRTPPQPPPAQFPSAAHMGQPGTQLPPLTLSTSIANRSNPAGPGPSMLQHQQAASQQNAMSNPGSASSHGQSSGSSMREILGGPSGSDADIWSYVRQLEGKFVRMQDEYELRISRLQEEVISLRGQQSNPQPSGQSGTYPNELRY